MLYMTFVCDLWFVAYLENISKTSIIMMVVDWQSELIISNDIISIVVILTNY